MRTLRVVLVMLMSLGSLGLAQTEAHKMDPPKPAAAPKSEAQLSFDLLKTLAGEWEGAVETDMPEALKAQLGAGADMKPLHVTMRVTSRGNVLVHEFQEANTPLDPKKYDHPVTMMYLDSGQLNLVHYCDAGNRPRMTGKMSPDGKRLEFDFVELSGSDKFGHMEHAVFTVIDENHHVEEWRFRMKTPKGEQVVNAKFDLFRKPASASAGAAR